MAESFYTSNRWKALRRRALCRDGYKCAECRKYLRSRDATTVHHIADREHFPALQWDLDNLVSLCGACHNRKHPEKGRRSAVRDE